MIEKQGQDVKRFTFDLIVKNLFRSGNNVPEPLSKLRINLDKDNYTNKSATKT